MAPFKFNSPKVVIEKEWEKFRERGILPEEEDLLNEFSPLLSLAILGAWPFKIPHPYRIPIDADEILPVYQRILGKFETYCGSDRARPGFRYPYAFFLTATLAGLRIVVGRSGTPGFLQTLSPMQKSLMVEARRGREELKKQAPKLDQALGKAWERIQNRLNPPK